MGLIRDKVAANKARYLTGEDTLRACGFALMDAAQKLAYDVLGRPDGPVDPRVMLRRFADLYDVLELIQRHTCVLPEDIQAFRARQSELEGRLLGRYDVEP